MSITLGIRTRDLYIISIKIYNICLKRYKRDKKEIKANSKPPEMTIEAMKQPQQLLQLIQELQTTHYSCFIHHYNHSATK